MFCLLCFTLHESHTFCSRLLANGQVLKKKTTFFYLIWINRYFAFKWGRFPYKFIAKKKLFTTIFRSWIILLLLLFFFTFRLHIYNYIRAKKVAHILNHTHTWVEDKVEIKNNTKSFDDDLSQPKSQNVLMVVSMIHFWLHISCRMHTHMPFVRLHFLFGNTFFLHSTVHCIPFGVLVLFLLHGTSIEFVYFTLTLGFYISLAKQYAMDMSGGVIDIKLPCTQQSINNKLIHLYLKI